ncbi:MAG: Glutamine-dependent NAD(+) synthetase [Alphaproteobacteria bacterium MarineAlpha8_Bin1]|nr:MAG: Glutamine-dependent NAD(+) synthetase [Alphaproteobacteria bacterium MarineAlpha8_Bin1]
MISLNDYFKKNNFSTALIGISGGIDSALTASIAADVLGSSNIKSFFLPSIYTSKESRTDAKDLCENLNISLEEISIESSRKLILGELSFLFKNLKKDITEENVQSRIRGLLLMALSNKFNSLLLTTGNKSELLVGYSTLYGDMCGGFSLLKDLYKTEINELCKWRNKNTSNRFKINKKDIIPSNILLKEPTAELKFNQKDSDTLPSYDILDKILYLLIDKNKDLKTIMNKGFKEKIVRKIWKMVKNSEFKRYQSALGPKVSEMSLDRDRRFPITNKFIL